MDNIINMKFLELEKAHREYLIKGNMNLFNEYTEKRVWDLVDLNEEIVEKDILGFLNKWGLCRIPYDRKTELLQALINVKEDIKYFEGKKLWENFNFKNKEQRTHLRNIFSELEDIDKISSVAISKIMHIFNPYFFMMWDNAIMKSYGFSGNVEGYLYFLQKIKSEIFENNLLDYYEESKIRDEVTLLKLIDEYNMERMR